MYEDLPVESGASLPVVVEPSYVAVDYPSYSGLVCLVAFHPIQRMRESSIKTIPSRKNFV